MNKVTSILFAFSMMAAGSPCNSFSTGTAFAETASAQSQLSLSQQTEVEALLRAAYEESLSDTGLTEKTINSLRPLQTALLPYLQKGISVSEDRFIPHPISLFDSGYMDFQFWLKIANQLDVPKMEPLFLAWLSDNRPIPDSYALQTKIGQLVLVGRENTLTDLMDRATPEGMSIILNILQERGKLNQAELERLTNRFADKPQMLAIIQLNNNPDWLKKLYDSEKMSLPAQRKIVENLINGNQREWLQKTAKNTTDRYIEQLIDAQLVRKHGDKAAAARLYKSGMQHGFTVALDGLTEKFLADLYPNGVLSQGIRDYQQIRGAHYFYQYDDDNWYSYESAGKDYRQPQVAIPQWLAFIKKYPQHPAVDDAAYRLARCYQQTGQFSEALYWFDQVKQLGDRDLIYDTTGQFLYVLDVEMGTDAFAKLDASRLPAWAKPWLEYSSAVEQLRERKYADASQSLQRFVERYQGQNLFAPAAVRQQTSTDFLSKDEEFVDPLGSSYPFWQQIKQQLILAKELAAKEEKINQAAGAEKAKQQYQLAAQMYRNPLLYYNHLWRGERQTFFWLGQIKYMDYNEALDRYIGRFNHLAQAITAFNRIDLQQADAETAAKTLYSLALSHAKLTEYGEEVRFYATKTGLSKQLITLCERLVKQYPSSDLADDALLLAYHYSSDQKYLQQLIAKYPQGDQAKQAKELLQTKKDPQAYEEKPQYANLLFQTLTLDDWRVPASIKDWVKKQQGTAYKGYKRDGEWFYVYIAAKQGERVWLTLETDSTGTSLSFSRQKQNDPVKDGQDRPDRLIRVPYRFVQDNKIEWKPL